MNNLKKLLADGLAVALPLGICFYIFRQVIDKVSALLSPIVKHFPLHPWLAAIILFLAAVALVVLGLIALGLLLKLPGVSWLRDLIEDMALRLFPALNHLKSLLSEKFDLPHSSQHWEPVVLHTEHKFHLAFLIEESADMATFLILNGTNVTSGEATTLAAGSYSYRPITLSQLTKHVKQYGAGLSELWSPTSQDKA